MMTADDRTGVQAVKPYKLYRGGRRRGVKPRKMRAVQGGAATGGSAKTSRFRGLGLVKTITTLVMIAGLGLILYAAWVFGYGYYQAKAGQNELRSLFSISSNKSVDPESVRRQAEAMNGGLGYLDPVGEISIPKIGVTLMMVQGSDKEALKKGPGHIEETRLPGMDGNFAVAGDRVLYGAPFFKLNEIEPGDEVKVKMPYATFVYRVKETFIVTPDDVSVLRDPGYDAITLLTCDPPWDIKQRIVVRGEVVEVQPAGTEL